MAAKASNASDVIGMELDITVKSGKGLVAKDGSGLFKLGKAKTSDPYVVITVDPQGKGKKVKIRETQMCKKTLDPEWNETFKWQAEGRQFKPASDLVFTIFDRDRGSSDDPMGEVRFPLSSLFDGQVRDSSFEVKNCSGCKDASGTLQLSVSCAVRRSLALEKGNTMRIDSGILAVGLGWDMLQGNRAIDLDTSCVCVAFDGRIMMEECVYFAQLRSKSGAITHTGDEMEGDEDLGQGDDEIILVDTSRLPGMTCALYFVATVATEGHSFADVKSSRMRFVDWGSGAEKCRYMPAMTGAHTALIGARIARKGPSEPWTLSAIGEVDHTARDWGTLVPEVKLYSQDIIKGIKVDANERVAIMRKGGVIRVKDYCPSGVPDALCLGLAWDVTNGVNIDLDASAILLDDKLRQLDLVFFGKLASSDGAIRHGGDEREGDEKGDDEKIFLSLSRVHPSVKYLGFVINSYSGQELDDVKDAACHLFDHSSFRDIASFRMTNCKALDKHTAFVVGMLYRDGATGEWAFEIIAEAAQGRTAHDNVDELQRFIQRRPDRHLPPPRLPPGNAQGMMRTVTERSLNVATGFVNAGGSAASAAVGLVRTASGRITQAMLPPQQQVVAVGVPPGGQVPQGQPVVAQAVPLV